MEIAFQVDGDPKPQPRPRAFARRMGAKFVARVYDAGTAEGWKSRIAMAVKPLLPSTPIEGPVAVSLVLFLRRPQNLCRQKDPREEIPHTSAGDCDNFAKGVLDALTQLGLWRDDRQVFSLHVSKYYTAIDGRPGMHAVVTWGRDAIATAAA